MSSIFIGHNPYLYVMPERPTVLPAAKIGCRGFFRLTSRVPDGKGGLRVHRQHDIPDWIPNLITDNGLNGVGTDGISWANTIALGTGTATPNVADTSLSGTVVSVTGGTATSGAYTAGTPRYKWVNWSKTFSQGAVTGTWTEIGIGRTSTNLWSRARILDSGGSPSSVTYTSIEVVTVEYRLEVYQDEVERTGTVVIAGVTYGWTTRAYDGLRPGQTSFVFQSSTSGLITGNLMVPGGTGNSYAAGIYSGALNANYAVPSTGTSQGGVNSRSVAAYASGSYTKVMTLNWVESGGNIAGGIAAVVPYIQGEGFNGGDQAGKIGFSPAIPKDNTKVMSLTFSWTWGRL
jgi:hypothetical protein